MTTVNRGNENVDALRKRKSDWAAFRATVIGDDQDALDFSELDLSGPIWRIAIWQDPISFPRTWSAPFYYSLVTYPAQCRRYDE